MGFRGIGSIILLLLIVIIIFGTKRLRNIGQDLGFAVKSFRQGLQEGEEKESNQIKKNDEQL